MSQPQAVRDPDAIALPIGSRRSSLRERMARRLQTAAIGLFLATVIAFPLTIGLSTWTDHQSLKKEWAISGPPCPQVAQISRAALGAKPPPPFVYRGVGYAYQIGDVLCEAVPDGYFTSATHSVCQFDAPGAISVKAAGRPVIFEPGIGHKATVSVRDGKVSCVIGGWFTAYGPLG
jgi:hypothetical protein